MKKRTFKGFDIDERQHIVKELSKQFFLQQYETDNLLVVQNPVLKVHADGVVCFDCVNQMNEFYFCSLSFYKQ